MALSADTSPPSARRDPEQPSGNSGQGETAEQASDAQNRDPAALPGLPRLFFADEPDRRQDQLAGRPYGQPGGGVPGSLPGQPGGFGQPTGPAGQERPGQSGGVSQQPAVPGGGRRLAVRPARPARPRPTRPPDRELRQRGIASVLLGVASLFALIGLRSDPQRFVYLLIFSAVIGVASVVIGITAVLKARRTGSFRPRGVIGGIILGSLAAVLSIPLLAWYIAFPRPVDNYITCITQTQTTGGDKTCLDKFYRSIRSGAEGLGSHRSQGSADGPPGRLADGAASPFFDHLSR
jgi:hypothetical protein